MHPGSASLQSEATRGMCRETKQLQVDLRNGEVTFSNPEVEKEEEAVMLEGSYRDPGDLTTHTSE